MPTQTTLDQETRDIVKSTVPVLQKHGAEITARFYELMFANHPELKNIFNQTNQRKGDQAHALANTVYAAAAHIDHLEEILPHVKPIAHKHRSLNIKPEHYPIVGKHLLLAMKELLDEKATPQFIEAWEKAYQEIAQVFISVEQDMYEEVENNTGGWVDYRPFKVVKKEVESDVITSFYLQPADGNPFPTYQPGQYITIKADIEGEPYTHLRQYTLSCAPGNPYYRISVKREDACDDNPAGIVSTYLHEHVNEGDTLPISAPAGDFVLNQNDEKPLVLLSGGVGITPMMSMLDTVIKEQPNREVLFIHATKSGSHHAMKEHVTQIESAHPQVTSYTVYSEPLKEDDSDYDRDGHIDYEWLTSVLPTNQAEFYFCGPEGFMRSMYQILKKFHVAEENIHFEFFGPAQVIAAS